MPTRLSARRAGPGGENTELAISTDGRHWIELGLVGGGTRSVDLADYGVDPEERFHWVRLRSTATKGCAGYPGPDIDAVGILGACRLRPAGS